MVIMAKKAIRAKKNLIVVAYDVSDDRRRNRVMKLLLKYGSRINYSVFECMVTDAQLKELQKAVLTKIDVKEDSVVYYPICVNCYSKVCYQRPSDPRHDAVTVL